MDTIKELSKKLNIVNLFPGILIVSELILLGLIKIESLLNSFFDTLFLLVICYSVGLISNIVSRLLIDWLSENFTRSLFLHMFAHITLKKSFRNAKKMKSTDDLKSEIMRFRFSNCIRLWNYSYRSYISKASNDEELKKRRDQGRYVRNLLFPLILGYFILIENCKFDLWVNIIGVIACTLIILLLYSYSELSSFQEAKDIIKK